ADYRWGPDGTTQPTFTEEELKALVEAAHTSGRPVSAHAATAEGMRLALMAARKVAFLPTLTAEEAISEYFQSYVPGKTAPTEDMKHAAQAFGLAMKL